MRFSTAGVCAVSLVAVLTAVPASLAAAPLCNTQKYSESWCGEWPECTVPNNPGGTTRLSQAFYCADGSPAGEVENVAGNMWGCWLGPPDPASCQPSSTVGNCANVGRAETCDGKDNNFDGCVDEGCTYGEGDCACERRCAAFSCNSPTTAACSAYSPERQEKCGDGVDNNCNGRPDEGCPGGNHPKCLQSAGTDPIYITTRSAVTEPFTDFEVEHVTKLSLTRVYTSADASLTGGPYGAFGRGWSHDWDARLTCRNGVCTVTRGNAETLRFGSPATVHSPDGIESWTLYSAYAVPGAPPDHHHVLVEKPDRSWVVFLTDGRELHFRTVCDACTAEEVSSGVLCQDASIGGWARLTKVVEATGAATTVGYDRPAGTVLSLRDDLGHELQLRSAQACTTGLVDELAYQGSIVARYT